MHKELHILGLLRGGPKTGYDLHRIVVAHGELFADLKRGNVYYLLERLAHNGDLRVESEPGARGPRRERLIYSLTDQGRDHFQHLLRKVVRTFEPAHTGVEVGMIFLSSLTDADAIALLEERRANVVARRDTIEHEAPLHDALYQQLAFDHLTSLIDAELTWIDRALCRLHDHQVAHKHEDPPPQCVAQADA